MNLGFFRDLQNNFKNIEVNKFIQELENYLKSRNEELGILEQVQKENKVSMISENKMRNKQNEILKNYAEDKNAIYFVSSKSKTNNEYILFKYENQKRSTVKLNSKELPINSGVNSILIKNNGKYVLDKFGTEYIKDGITKISKDILKEQNEKLQEFRKEGHLYMVEEDINNKIFLKDLNSKSNLVLEEVDFPKELKNEATEGTVFKYEKGEYKFYSQDGFERILGTELQRAKRDRFDLKFKIITSNKKFIFLHKI